MKRAIQQRARWAAGAVAAAAFLLGSAPSSASAEGAAYVLSDVQCDANHNGVLDLTLVNDQASAPALFVIAEASASTSSSISVAAASVSAITFTDLADGAVIVPVSVDGVEAPVVVRVACDAPEVAVMAAPVRQQAGEPTLPSTGSSSTGGLIIGGVLVAAGIGASLLARRRYS